MKRILLNINNTKLVTLMLILFLSSFPLLSQSQKSVEITADSTLQDLLAEAALNNPGLKAAFHQWKAALEKVPQVRALPNPQLNFAYFIREVETRVGPQQGKAGIMQMFPWFGKLKLKGSAALEAAEAKRHKYENVKLNLFYRVKEAYFDYYYITRTITILKANVQLLEYLERVIEAKYRTGTASYSSLLKIQVELDKLQNRLQSAKEVLKPVKVRLNAALNRLPETPLPIPGQIQPDDLQISEGRLKELLKKDNPVLKSMDSTAAMEQVNIKLAMKKSFPDFSIGIDYMFTGEARMSGVPDSGKDPIAAMLSIRLPLWSKKNKAAVKEADARHRAALNKKKEEENRLLARLEMVLFQYRDAQRKIALYKNSLLPRAQQALEVTRSAFETGKADFLDFIDSQRIYLAFELEYEKAKTSFAKRLAELEMLVGETIATKKHKEHKGD